MKDKKTKGEFQHRMFKLIILIVVFVFCGLIAGFIYITITSKNSFKVIDNDYKTEESIIKSNKKYHLMMQNQDRYNFNTIYKFNQTYLLTCDKNTFYKEHISFHFPCLYKYNASDDIYILNNIMDKKDIYISPNKIGSVDFIDKYMKLLSVEFYNKNNNNEEYFRNPRLDNLGRVIINNSNQKVHIYLLPISQIEYFNSYQNKSSSDIIYFFLKNNIDDRVKDKNNKKEIIYYEFYLEEAGFIYVPSYYFLQIKEPVENLISYEYQDISQFNDMVFKILYSF